MLTKNKCRLSEKHSQYSKLQNTHTHSLTKIITFKIYIQFKIYSVLQCNIKFFKFKTFRRLI